MPIFKSRYKHVKILRPNGALYAEGKANAAPLYGEMGVITAIVVEMAVNGAFRAFEQEFKRPPCVDLLVVEVVCDLLGAKATVLEIPIDEV
jgi:hypothetical protein